MSSSILLSFTVTPSRDSQLKVQVITINDVMFFLIIEFTKSLFLFLRKFQKPGEIDV